MYPFFDNFWLWALTKLSGAEQWDLIQEVTDSNVCATQQRGDCLDALLKTPLGLSSPLSNQLNEGETMIEG